LPTHLPLQIVGVAPITASAPQEAALLRLTRMPELIDLEVSHYIRTEFFLKLLKTKRLYLGRLDTQKNDPKDGCLPTANLAPPSGLNEQYYSYFPTKRDPQMNLEQQGIARQLSYIHCWFKGHKESRQMWEDFGSNGTGVCIQSTTARLKNSIRSGWPNNLIFTIHECPYTDSIVQVPEFLPDIASVRKDSSFKDQQEIRILAQVDVTKGSAPLPGPDHKLVPVDLDALLSRIIIGSAMPLEEERAISDAIVEMGLQTPVVRSVVQPGG
jgi:hypothetical protein